MQKQLFSNFLSIFCASLLACLAVPVYMMAQSPDDFDFIVSSTFLTSGGLLALLFLVYLPLYWRCSNARNWIDWPVPQHHALFPTIRVSECWLSSKAWWITVYWLIAGPTTPVTMYSRSRPADVASLFFITNRNPKSIILTLVIDKVLTSPCLLHSRPLCEISQTEPLL